MHVMGKLTSSHRLQALSIPQVTEQVDRLVLRNARLLKFRDRKISTSHLLNAVVLHFLTLPEAEQDRAVARELSRLEAMLAQDEMGSPVSAGDFASNPTEVRDSRPGETG